jgi:hypothetical protein
MKRKPTQKELDAVKAHDKKGKKRIQIARSVPKK